MFKKLFHKIVIGFKRKFEKSIPAVEENKKFGRQGEDYFAENIKLQLPTCEIKRNVFVSAESSNAEIDCLILYENKLFAVEIKNWKGELTESNDGGVVQKKTDKWTGKRHEKCLRSPFGQIKRAVYLLKKQIPGSVWINAIVYFNNGAYRAEPGSEETWFADINETVRYIKTDGEPSYGENAYKFFRRCIESDCLKNKDNFLCCAISDESLRFSVDNELLTRNDISGLRFKHHWSYDEVCLALKTGKERKLKEENLKLKVTVSDGTREYAVCKLNDVELGNNTCPERIYGRRR